MNVQRTPEKTYPGWVVVLVGLGLAGVGVGFVAGSGGGYGLVLGISLACVVAPITVVVGIVAMIRRKRVKL